MFNTTLVFNQPIDSWDVSSVTDMSYMLSYSKVFDQPINSWDVSSVTDMNEMFWAADEFNQDIGAWDVSNVTNMAGILGDTGFNQDISAWDVSNVEDMSYMFRNAGEFNQPLNNWDVSNVTNMRNMLSGAIAFNQDISAWDVSNVTNMSGMLNDVTLSVASFDYLLLNWEQLSLQNGVSFNEGSSQYCVGADAINILIGTYGWNMNDNGFVSTDGAGGCIPLAQVYAPIKVAENIENTTIEIFDDKAITAANVSVEAFNTTGGFTVDGVSCEQITPKELLCTANVLKIPGTGDLRFTVTDSDGNQRIIEETDYEVLDPFVAGNGKASFSGSQRYNQGAGNDERWTQEEVLADNNRIDRGWPGKVMTYTNANGHEVFAGYVAGRLSMDKLSEKRTVIRKPRKLAAIKKLEAGQQSVSVLVKRQRLKNSAQAERAQFKRVSLGRPGSVPEATPSQADEFMLSAAPEPQDFAPNQQPNRASYEVVEETMAPELTNEMKASLERYRNEDAAKTQVARKNYQKQKVNKFERTRISVSANSPSRITKNYQKNPVIRMHGKLIQMNNLVR